MTPLTVNIALALAVALIGGGAAAEWGAPIGAIITGLLILVCTYAGLLLTLNRRKG